MKISDAANILGLTGDITHEIVKKAYRVAVKKYHPDVNPAGEEMMKIINDAYSVLKDYQGSIPTRGTESASQYPEELNSALNSIITLSGLMIEVCGSWVWVTGDTMKHRKILKDNGFKYASKKKAWHFRPDNWKSKSRGKSSLDDIRLKYGSTKPDFKERKRINN